MMSVIKSNKKEDIIKTLKELNEHVFKVTKEVIYAIPENAVYHYKDYKDFLKFAKEHPKKVFVRYYHILTEIKEIEEL